MAITLSLNNVDAKATTINIYRSVNTPVLAGSPGTPVATIAAPASTWTDTDVVNYNVYHYRVEVSDGVNRTMSENQMVGYYPDSGPGNNFVRRGDWMSGWMDELTTEQFISSSDLLSMLQAAGLVASAAGSITNWAKVAFSGKVLMVPNSCLCTATWLAVYNAGMMYGTNDMGAHPAVVGLVETNQRKTVQVKGNTYIVRTMRSVSGSPAAYVPDATVAADMTSENWQVRVRLCDDGNSAAGPARFSDFAPSGMATMGNTLRSNNVTTTLVSNGTTSSTLITNAAQWLPVLELAPGL